MATQVRTGMRRGIILAALLVGSGLLAACAQEPPPRVSGPDPADPLVPVQATAYRPVLGNYVSRRPVEALPPTAASP